MPTAYLSVCEHMIPLVNLNDVESDKEENKMKKKWKKEASVEAKHRIFSIRTMP